MGVRGGWLSNCGGAGLGGFRNEFPEEGKKFMTRQGSFIHQFFVP